MIIVKLRKVLLSIPSNEKINFSFSFSSEHSLYTTTQRFVETIGE